MKERRCLRFLTGDSNSAVGGGVKFEGRREGDKIEEAVAMADKACRAATWVRASAGVAGMISGGASTGFDVVRTSPVRTLGVELALLLQVLKISAGVYRFCNCMYILLRFFFIS